MWFRAAIKSWTEAVDTLLGIENAVNDWQQSLSKNSSKDVDLSAELLKRCGLWGSLLAGVICSNIAQYVIALSTIH